VTRPARKRPRRRWRIAGFLPNARLRRHAWRAFSRAPMLPQALIVLAIAAILWLAVNWIYQVVRKPSELFFPVSGNPFIPCGLSKETVGMKISPFR